MQGFCKLCNNHSRLEESHFIPRFIVKWLKKTSVTSFLRNLDDMDKRVQDTAKEYWLCGDCEDLFSGWETKFANRIFFPFVDGGELVANYGEWMSKFCASISWRTLTYTKSQKLNEGKSKEYYEALDSAEKHLAKYVLGKIDNLNQYEQHVFPLTKIESATHNELPPNINRYFLRTLEMGVIGDFTDLTDLFVYTKVPSFIILGCIKAKELPKMRSSRIALKSGTISTGKHWWPSGFAKYLVEQADRVNHSFKKIPQRDLAKIEKSIADNPEKAANSKLIEAFLHDYALFGDKVFK